jgi:flagellar basal-body rod modification protein FlgD
MGVESIGNVNTVYSQSAAANKANGTDLSINDFFKLIAAQLQNQTMFDTVDSTQFIAQLAQFTTLSQIGEMKSAINTNLAVELLGKPVCVSRTTDTGEVMTTVGNVEQISFDKGIPYLYVNGAFYKLDEVYEIGAGNPSGDRQEAASDIPGD